MNRTKTYLGTFVNNAEGISSYKLMVKNVRNTVTGGRFVNGIILCTINPIDRARYKHLDFLMTIL